MSIGTVPYKSKKTEVLKATVLKDYLRTQSTKDHFGLIQIVKTKISDPDPKRLQQILKPSRFVSDRIQPLFPLRYYTKTIFLNLTNLSCLRAVVI
jgi:hypothetical protein